MQADVNAPSFWFVHFLARNCGVQLVSQSQSWSIMHDESGLDKKPFEV